MSYPKLINGPAWLNNNAIIGGLSPTVWYATPTVFSKDNNWYLISGKEDGLFNGWKWNSTAWVIDSGITNGLTDVGKFSSPAVFYKDNDWYLISGEQDGVWNGWKWVGSAWISDSGIISGLTDVGTYSSPTVFYKDGNWYLISGEVGGDFYGWKWVGSAWVFDSDIVGGLTAVEAYSAPTVFYKNNAWYLIAGERNGIFSGWKWNSIAWISNTEIVCELGDVGLHSRPTVFYKDNDWYLISGEQGYAFTGWKWEDAVKLSCGEEIIAECESSENWSWGPATSFSDDYVISGTETIKFDGPAASNAQYNFPFPRDYSYVGGFSFFVYLTTAAPGYPTYDATLDFAFLATDITGPPGTLAWSTFTITPGWNHITIPIDGFDSIGAGHDWTNILQVAFSAVGVAQTQALYADYITTDCNSWDICGDVPNPELYLGTYSLVTGTYAYQGFHVLKDTMFDPELQLKRTNSRIAISGAVNRQVTFPLRSWQFTLLGSSMRERSQLQHIANETAEDAVLKLKIPAWSDTEYYVTLDELTPSFRRHANRSRENFDILLREYE